MFLFSQIKHNVSKFIDSLENENIPLINYFFIFLFSITIRNFIECYSQPYNYLNLPADIFLATFIHFTLFYIALALLLIVIFYFATRTSINKIIRVVLPSFILLLIAPSLDLLLTQGKGALIYYLEPNSQINFLYTYFTLGGGFEGASTGIKIEIDIALLGCFIYFRIKKLDFFESIFYTWLSYSSIFLLALSPIIIKWVLNLFNFEYIYTTRILINYFSIFILLLGTFVFYITNKKLFLILLKDLRLLRILHYELMLLLGLSLALVSDSTSITSQLFFKKEIIINTLFCMISIFFSGLFSIIMNNITDREIDKISNKNRPLIANQVNPIIYQRIAYFALVVSIFYAALVGEKELFLIGITIASYYLYSMPPFRFKRVTVFSKLAISLNSIALILLGFIIVQNNVDAFPHQLFWIFFIGYTISLNFIDLKDIEGDKAGGILTLPILLSEERAKIIIGVGFLFTYLSFYFLIKDTLFLGILFITGCIQFYFINKKAYKEQRVIITYILSVLFLIVYVFKLKI